MGQIRSHLSRQCTTLRLNTTRILTDQKHAGFTTLDIRHRDIRVNLTTYSQLEPIRKRNRENCYS
jgi:hypothetical protein